MVGVGDSVEFAINEGKDFGCEEFGQESAVWFWCGEEGVGVGNVFVGAALAWTVDADHDKRFD